MRNQKFYLLFISDHKEQFATQPISLEIEY